MRTQKRQLPYHQANPVSFCKAPGLGVSLVLLAASLFIFPRGTALAQSPSPQQSDFASIEGRLRDSKGGPVAGASVFLDDKQHRTLAETKTNEDGRFVFPALRSATYTLRAEKSGMRTASIPSVLVPRGRNKRVDLVLEDSEALPSAPQFADQPNFTVAGVTDAANMGGHGSDTNVRTSEMLARETIQLKSGAERDSTAAGPADRETENKLRTAVVSAPGNFQANHQLGEFYFRSGRYSEATPLLQAAYRIDPANYANAYYLALVYQANGDAARAREHARNLLASAEKAEVYRLLGDLDEQLGDPLAAVREYESAARLEPSEQNYFNWATELLLHKAPGPAVEVFTKGAGGYPHSARMLAGLGAAQFANGSYADAARYLCDASDLYPADPAPYLFLGKMTKAAPDPLPCAREKLARFAKEQPGNALANYYYAAAVEKDARASGNAAALVRAGALLEKSVAIDAQFADAYVLLGIVFSERGEVAPAINAYEKAITANPQSGEAHYRLGLAYKRVGEEAKARVELQLYKQINDADSLIVDRQRHELQQFMILLKEQPAPAAPH